MLTIGVRSVTWSAAFILGGLGWRTVGAAGGGVVELERRNSGPAHCQQYGWMPGWSYDDSEPPNGAPKLIKVPAGMDCYEEPVQYPEYRQYHFVRESVIVQVVREYYLVSVESLVNELLHRCGKPVDASFNRGSKKHRRTGWEGLNCGTWTDRYCAQKLVLCAIPRGKGGKDDPNALPTATLVVTALPYVDEPPKRSLLE